MAGETTVDGPGAGPGGASARAAAALTPRAVPDGGVTLSPAAVAALAELFRAIGRGRDAAQITDVADRAARGVLRGMDAAPATPTPRTPGDQEVLAAR